MPTMAAELSGLRMGMLAALLRGGVGFKWIAKRLYMWQTRPESRKVGGVKRADFFS
jgi:hypothetical protein